MVRVPEGATLEVVVGAGAVEVGGLVVVGAGGAVVVVGGWDVVGAGVVVFVEQLLISTPPMTTRQSMMRSRLLFIYFVSSFFN
jgi:hypothetical protein